MARSVERKIPAWIFEFLTLVVILFALRWWLKRKDRRIGAPAGPPTVQVLRVAPYARPVSPEETTLPQPTQAAAEGPVTVTSGDDLTRIQGIGPKVAALLKSAGIHSFAELAEQNEASLRALLREAGLPMINPAAWPEQARQMAAEDSVSQT